MYKSIYFDLDNTLYRIYLNRADGEVAADAVFAKIINQLRFPLYIQLHRRLLESIQNDISQAN